MNKKNKIPRLNALLMIMTINGYAHAIQPINFEHQDWEIYCSNTGTCRAAGYQHEDGQNDPASILLTRQSGAKQSIRAQFALAGADEQQFSKQQVNNIHFYINGKDLGKIQVDGVDSPLMGQLSATQVHELLQHVGQQQEIVFKNAHFNWQISDAGMTAVLLKMDDVQKRVGTVGALVKKGRLDESQVLQAQPKLQVTKVKTAEKPYLTLTPKSKQYTAVYRLLMTAKNRPKEEDFCEGIYDGQKYQSQAIELYKLSSGKVLATMPCWRGAYNEGAGIWVLAQALTGQASFVTDSASDVGSGEINSAQKGRGIGDCWSSEQWIWDGQTFLKSLDRWSGMCKGLAAGGVWQLDKIESVVK